MSRLLQLRLALSTGRLFSTTTIRTAFATGPSPPRLPPKEQEEFERLQRQSTGAFSTPRPSVIASQTAPPLEASAQPKGQIEQSPASIAKTPLQVNSFPASKSGKGVSPVAVEELDMADINMGVQAMGKGEELHPDIRRGAKPEFDGDVNPITGEVGGPKNEPLRWGSTGEKGDWSYNGRVTDF